MSDALQRTWDVLRTTKNGEADRLLIAWLDGPDPELAESALRTMVHRRSDVVHRELLRRWGTFSDARKQIVGERPGCMSGVLRDAVLGGDAETFRHACDALVWLREYDLVASLITAAEDRANPLAGLAAATVVKLAELLYDQLAGPRDYRERRDPQLVRRHVVASLEQSLGRYGHHDRKELIEAFLMLAGRDNSLLKRILVNPHAKSYLPVIELLSTSQQPGVMRLLLSFLDDPGAPNSTINVMVNRRDASFLHRLLKQIGHQPTDVARNNLRRVESISWVSEQPHELDTLPDAEQHAAIQLLMATRVNRLQVFEVVRYLSLHGKVGGRRAAAAVLSEFNGADANKLVVNALDDPDPEVQVQALLQLRKRGIPGALTRLISLVDSPHGSVREAAQECLDEFSFVRYLAAFDMLSDSVRASTGRLVKKVDPRSLPLLVEELSSKSRTRRLRGLSIAAVMDFSRQVEERILELMEDEDHFVRAAAAAALSRCNTSTARSALRAALLDRSVQVQQAAEQSLEALNSVREPSTRTGPADVASVRKPR